MNSRLYTFDSSDDWATHTSTVPMTHLEEGNILYDPNLAFTVRPDEQVLLNPMLGDGQKKNISYDPLTQKLKGVSLHHPHRDLLHAMLQRYAKLSKTLIETLLPQYQPALRWGRTSYRPSGIVNRERSKRQDDRRIHVDAFVATPVQGLRILRVFCNINPHNAPRVWEVGESFAAVLAKFAPNLPKYNPFTARLLYWLQATKSLRSPYDHYMLSLHDAMKQDDTYQAHVAKEKISFRALSTWIVFSDYVSHAALSGQYLLEQTFYLPVSAMHNPANSPAQHLLEQGLLKPRIDLL